MIKLNTPYSIENGKDQVIFTESGNNTITGTYKDGTLNGKLNGNTLSATFQNTKVNVSGLMEITFNEKGFDGRWKKGIEPGSMKGKWKGELNYAKSEDYTKNNNCVNLTIEQQECIIDNYVTSYDFLDLTKEEWRSNRTFILAALNNDGKILELLSDEFKKDKEIVITAAVNDIASLEYADDSLKTNKEVLQAIVENDKSLSYLLNDNLSQEQKLCFIQGLSHEDFDPEFLEDSDEKIGWMKEKEFVLEAIKIDEKTLKFASSDLKSDKELVTLATIKNISAIEYADEKLQCDPEIILKSIISNFENESDISIKDEDIYIFTNENQNYDPTSALRDLNLKVRYIVLTHNKNDFKLFNSKLLSFINSNHECFWIIQALIQELLNIQNILDNYNYFYKDEGVKEYYKKVSEIIDSFDQDLEFSPNEEFDTYFIDDQIDYSWDNCKWSDIQDGEGKNFTEFIMERAEIEWDNENWSDKKYYNYGISSLWIGLQNYSLRHSREDLNEENTAVALYSVIDEKYEPIQESGNGHFGAFVFKIVTEFLLGIKQNEYDLNSSDDESLEDFNGYQYDLKRVANNICNRDLFDDWPGASEFED
jgi:hypothetical protein